MFSRVLLCLFVLALSGCGGTCLEPGQGVSSSFLEVKVPVKPRGADRKNPVTYWVNSGQRVKKEQEIKLTVELAINLCPRDTAADPAFIKMFPEDFVASRSQDSEFYDTYINVVKGDILVFSPYMYTIHNPPCKEAQKMHKKNGVLYYGDGDFFSNNGCSTGIEATKICSSGIYGDSKNTYVKMGGNNNQCMLFPEGLELPRPVASQEVLHTMFPIGYFAKLKNYTEDGRKSLRAFSKNVVITGFVSDARTVKVAEVPEITDEKCKVLKNDSNDLMKYRIAGDFKELFKDGFGVEIDPETVKLLIDMNKEEKEGQQQKNSNGASSSSVTKPSSDQMAFLKWMVERHKLPSGQSLESVSLKDVSANGEFQKGREATKLLEEYTEYDINCNCGFICEPSANVTDDCIKSVVTVVGGKIMCPTPRLKKENTQPPKIKTADRKPLENGGKEEGIAALKEYMKSMEISVKQEDEIPNDIFRMAEGAIAVIVPTANTAVSSTVPSEPEKLEKDKVGDRCKSNSCKWLPNEVTGIKDGSGTFLQKSLKLNHAYIAQETGRLFLTYLKPTPAASSTKKDTADEGTPQGFYTLGVHRSCYADYGQRLYMYIGESPPDTLPGTATSGAVSLDLSPDDEKNNNNKGLYIINGKDGGEDNKKEGYVFFGIEVDPAYDEQLKNAMDNTNYYSVRLWIPTWEPLFSRLFALLQGTIMNVLYGIPLKLDTNGDFIGDMAGSINNALKNGTKGAIQQIYDGQVTSKPFWRLIQAVLTLYLMFSALGYVLGMIKITKYDLAVRIAKVVLVIGLFSPGSWRFFNEHCFSLFITGTSQIISALSGYLEGDISFKFLDSTVGLLLSSDTWVRLAALLAAGPVGWLAFVGVALALASFFVAMFKAMLTYLFIMVAVAFLITLAPIFIAFILFQFTKQLFDAWLKMLVSFSLQPIILFTALAFLNQIILTGLHAVTDFTACENCAVGINIPSEDEGTPSRPDICLLPVMLPIGFSNELSIDDRIREGYARDDIGFMGLPFGVAIALVLIVACRGIKDFVHVAEAMAHSIAGSVVGVSASASMAAQSILGLVGLDAASQQLIHRARSMSPHSEDKLRFERGGVKDSLHRSEKMSDKDADSGVAAPTMEDTVGRTGGDVSSSDTRPRPAESEPIGGSDMAAVTAALLSGDVSAELSGASGSSGSTQDGDVESVSSRSESIGKFDIEDVLGSTGSGHGSDAPTDSGGASGGIEEQTTFDTSSGAAYAGIVFSEDTASSPSGLYDRPAARDERHEVGRTESTHTDVGDSSVESAGSGDDVSRASSGLYERSGTGDTGTKTSSDDGSKQADSTSEGGHAQTHGESTHQQRSQSAEGVKGERFFSEMERHPENEDKVSGDTSSSQGSADSVDASSEGGHAQTHGESAHQQRSQSAEGVKGERFSEMERHPENEDKVSGDTSSSQGSADSVDASADKSQDDNAGKEREGKADGKIGKGGDESEQ